MEKDELKGRWENGALKETFDINKQQQNIEKAVKAILGDGTKRNSG